MAKYRAGYKTLNNKGALIIAGVLIGVLVVGGAVLGLPYISSGHNVDGAFTSRSKKSGKASPNTSGNAGTTQTLSKPAMHVGLSGSTDPSLRKLAEYEQVYGGALADRVMVFAGLPASTEDASAQAADMAAKLKEFAKYHIAPLVILEPTVNGSDIKLTDFAASNYDAAMASYFNDLKAQGITDAQMGIWVPFPEPNIPDWGNTDAKLFETNAAKAARAQKQVFPNSDLSIMLNSQTFQTNDVNRDYGTFSSLLPYVRDLPKGLFSSFGLQGFPWVSAANQEKSQLLDPAQFLNANLAREAAGSLGVKQIWFNTGTFARMYTNDSKATVTFSPAQRQAILQGILAQAKVAQPGGFQVAVNIFALDGSNTGEAIDWSYWHTGQSAAQAPAQAVFKSFAEQVHENNMQLWLFDSAQ